MTDTPIAERTIAGHPRAKFEACKADRAARLAALQPAAVDLAAQLADAAAELEDERPAARPPRTSSLGLRGEAGSALNGWGRASMDANAWRELDRRLPLTSSNESGATCRQFLQASQHNGRRVPSASSARSGPDGG